MKTFKMVKQKEYTHIMQSWKNCAINCAMQGSYLMAISDFACSLTNQKARIL